MPSTSQSVPLAKIFNLPNQLTSLRLVLAVILFGLIIFEHYLSSMVLFILAAGTDWFDGYLARKYGQVTTLGRILDPFADKVIVCGTFIFLLAVPGMTRLLPAWMVVVIVGRELLVTALRSFIEEQGADFSAKMSGKLKMVLQCVAAGACLFYLHYPRPDRPDWVSWVYQHYPRPDAPQWVCWVMVLSIWSAVLLTIYSGVMYVFMAARLLQQERRKSA
ncbi:MAG: CDP-diacylglycerol--glycerol-3-phosphate 3-phosphatidyltransferase [Thermoguttaceae bacterium]|jgi:CDP-diacylglycerol--glycerol-3-phosphate 3-phosphatidyltransferase